MINKNDLIGIWYNENFQLTFSDNYIKLNTNINTEHKPYYTELIYSENYEFIVEENKIKISENMDLLLSSEMAKKIVLVINIDGIKFINLTKFK